MTQPFPATGGSYRSQTKKIAVDIVFANGDEESGEVHLQPSPMHADGFETALEMLSRDDPFFPLLRSAGGIALLAKAQTMVVACPREIPLEGAERVSVATQVDLEVELTSGARYRGTAMWEPPPGHSRLLDFVNEAGPYLPIAAETHTYYINRAHTRAVHPVD